MDARISACSFLIALGLGAPLAATPAEDYVIPGRIRLFDGTASGPARACAIFAAGLCDVDGAKCPRYRELLFLHVLAQTTMLLGDSDEAVPHGLLRWVEQLSAAFAGGGTAGMPDCRPVCSSTPRQIDRILAELGSITDRPTPFGMHLTPKETGLMNDLEVDFGDVLMLKAVLLACKASLQRRYASTPSGAAGWSLDPCALEGFDSWLGNAPDLLGFSAPSGEARGLDAMAERDVIRAGARSDWADAIACYLDAVAYILAEDDPQEDELVYVDPANRDQVDRSTGALTALHETLRGPTMTAGNHVGDRIYEVRDANSVRLGELVLVFDASNRGGESGRLTLADGTVLEIDWFGILDAGEVGISMFAPNQATQGWLQGAVTADRNAITDATLDLWGARNETLVAVFAELAYESGPLVGAAPEQPSLEGPLALDELLARTAHEENWGI